MIIEGQDSKMVRALAFFPLFISGGFFVHAHSQNSGLSGFWGIIFLAIGVWTCVAQRRRYIDTNTRVYATHSCWLWMRWGGSEPLSRFNHIGIIHDTSNIPGETRSSNSYDIYLFSGGKPERLFEIFKTRDEAIGRAAFISQHTGLPLRAD